MTSNFYQQQRNRGISRKLELIRLKGGKCEMCGYKKNIAALDFHHVNPSEKEFQLDFRHLSNNSMEKILKEAEKCILLCANCHREIHYPKMETKQVHEFVENIEKQRNSVSLKLKTTKCKHCGKEFPYSRGRIYCCEQCKKDEMYKGYPSFEEIKAKYKELKSWEKVAKYFNVTRRILRRIRKDNKDGLVSALPHKQ